MGWWAKRKQRRWLEEENGRLRQDNARLRSQVAELQAENARLLDQLAAARKHSGNSSKPPSSDIVKPPGQRRQKGKRRRGAQPGHPRQERSLLPPEQVDHLIAYQIDRCPVHGTPLTPSPTQKQLFQQAELVAKPIEVTQHELRGSWCARCQQWHWPQLPAAVQAGGLMGPRLTALVAYVKSQMHVSYRGVADFFQEVLGFKLCRGSLVKVLHQSVSEAVAEPVEALRALLPVQRVLNVDETGHKENGQSLWTWCFRAADFVVFCIQGSRGSEVLLEFLGREFRGILGCDYFSAYRKFMGLMPGVVQFCLAHLIRDLKFLAEHPDPMVALYGQPILRAVRRMFGQIHQQVEQPRPDFQSRLERVKHQIIVLATETRRLSPIEWYVQQQYPEVFNMAQRFRQHGEQYFTFLTTPGVDPTNNTAEQAMRFVVQDRRVTQGTRGENGQRYCERLWTVIGTCSLQDRSVFAYLVQAMTAFFNGQPAPSLLPSDTS